MRRIPVLVFVFAISMFLAGTVAQAGEIGAPAPYTKVGQFSMALGYSYQDSKFKPDQSSSGGFDFQEDKVKSNQIYLEGGYGFIKGWEGFLRVGGVDALVKNGIEIGGQVADFDSGFKPFGTLGVRGLFYGDKSFAVGGFLQGTLSGEFKDTKFGVEFKMKNPWEVVLGVEVQSDLGPAVVYAGPFLYMSRGKDEVKVLATGALAETNFKEKNMLGGAAGVRIPFAGSYYANLEGQYKSGGAFAVSVGKTF